METAVLIRDQVTSEFIRGTLTTSNSVYQILERPWVGNQRNISCIPPGKYIASYLPRSASGKYKRVFHLQPVEGRSGILIHNGNLVSHTRGCLIIGKRRGVLAGQAAVLNSKSALAELVDEMDRSDFYLEIIGNQTLSNDIEGQ